MSSRASGGTLAASLITAAIIGFAGGGYFGTQSGGADAAENPEETTAATTPGGGDSPDDQPTESPTETPEETGLSLTADTESIAPNNEINLDGSIESGEEGVGLRLERSLDGGDWTEFDLTTPLTTNAEGTFSTYVVTGREGVNAFRVVRTDDESVVSNEVEVTVG